MLGLLKMGLNRGNKEFKAFSEGHMSGMTIFGTLLTLGILLWRETKNLRMYNG